nr:hypothetical protein [Halomonas dongshanensis]
MPAAQVSPTAATAPTPSSPAVAPSSPSVSMGAQAQDWVPPYLTSPEEEAAYYVSRLADRRFVARYGNPAQPQVRYIAAERLGAIGAPAVPLLFARLTTQDDYEKMLVLYALQLATQDPVLMAQTGSDYVRLEPALDPAANASNQAIAQAWWGRHQHALAPPIGPGG